VLPAGLHAEATYARLFYELQTQQAALSIFPHIALHGGPRPRAYHFHELSPAELGPALERSGRYYASFHLALRSEEDLPGLHEAARQLDRQAEPASLQTLLRLLDLHPEWRQAAHPVLLRPAAPSQVY
jgi:hypothetical protein